MKFRNHALLVIGLTFATECCLAQVPRIVAHRGASFDAPENTLPAFRLAWEKGADAIEGDFYLTRDKKIVCIHDRTTKRYCEQNLAVADSTLKQLRSLDVGLYKSPRFRGVRIPTLTEVLSTVPQDKKIYIEIKCGPEIVPRMLATIQESGLGGDQVIFISFDRNVIAACKEASPAHKAFWLTGLKKQKGVVIPSIETVLQTLKKTGADGVSSSTEHLTQEYIQAIQRNGFEYHVWTINDPATARRLTEWGVQSITTDRPDEIRKAIQ